VAAEDERIRALDRLSLHLFGPVRTAHGGGTLVLAGRAAAPYGLAEVRARFPSSFAALPAGGLLLLDHLFVGRGAALEVSGAQVRALRLLSTPGRFVTVAGYRGTIRLTGGRARPLSVTSWDPDRRGPDPDSRDGRAFVVSRGGVMSSAGVEFAHLGFGPGRTSGVAWAGLDLQPVQGTVSDSRFHHNHLGAYAYRAVAMRWTGNAFWANRVHGFDAHVLCSGLLLKANSAHRNGGHGFVLSRGCRQNLLQGNSAHHNGGHGFTLDDGKAAGPADAGGLRPLPSSHNTVVGNRAEANRLAGIALDGGGGNAVRGNTLDRNRVGVQLRGAANGNAVDSNRIGGSLDTGVLLARGTSANRVVGNRVRGGSGGVTVQGARASRVEGNLVAEVLGSALVVDAGAGNALRNNAVDGARLGVDVRRRAVGNLVQGNRLAVSWAGVQLAQAADRNRVVANRVKGGRTGILVHDARNNQVDANIVAQVDGSGIALVGDARGSRVTRNHLAGRGPAAISRWRGARLAGVHLEGNHTGGWQVVRPGGGPLDRLKAFVSYHPVILVWLPILLLPAALAVPARLWRRWRTRRLLNLAGGRPVP
jgi:parallel beta-helix repeat protein